jgi:hypothetical protein
VRKELVLAGHPEGVFFDGHARTSAKLENPGRGTLEFRVPPYPKILRTGYITFFLFTRR